MRFLRFIFSIFIILIVMLLASMLLPSNVTVTKSILINAAQNKVDEQIKDFNNWKNWYPAFQNENVSVKNNPAKPGIINSVSLKDSKGKTINFDLMEFKRDTILVDLESGSSTQVSYEFIITSHTDGHTQLTWNVNASLGWYPWNKIKVIFLDKITGPQYEEALKTLKLVAEK
jgi:hypothetical protein